MIGIFQKLNEIISLLDSINDRLKSIDARLEDIDRGLNYSLGYKQIRVPSLENIESHLWNVEKALEKIK